MDPYFSRPEVSNSDLSSLKEYLYPREDKSDPTEAYKFGTLIDMMITENHKVNYFNLTCDGEQYTAEQFEQAKQMKKAFMKDPMCKQILDKSDFQKVMAEELHIKHLGFPFSLQARCKWDLYMPLLGWGGDIKSTAATTQKQCEDAARFFDYPRSRAWYMDIAGSEKDILLFISKVNFKIFKISIRRGDDFYSEGKKQYQELAFKYWSIML